VTIVSEGGYDVLYITIDYLIVIIGYRKTHCSISTIVRYSKILFFIDAGEKIKQNGYIFAQYRMYIVGITNPTL
jgi:hypothetical protein